MLGSKFKNSVTAASVLFLFAGQSFAQEDSLVLVTERSNGVVQDNNQNNNRLGAQESITLKAKGRIWAVKKANDADHNIICMNQSNNDIQLFNVGSDSPWLATNSSGNCEQMKSNVFACGQANDKSELVCRTQKIATRSGGAGITDMTAVALRSFDTSDEAFMNVANAIMQQHQVHFDLCQDIHGKHPQGGVSFTVKADGSIENTQTINTGELATPMNAAGYAQCIAQAIQLWQFPELDYVYEMEYAFLE